MIAVAVIFPWSVALVITFLGFWSEHEVRERVSLWLSLFNRAQHALSTAVAAAVAGNIRPGESTLRLVVSTLVAAIIYNICNTVLVNVGVSTRFAVSPIEAANHSFQPGFATLFGVVSLLALLFVVLRERVGVWSLALVALPVWLGYRALQSSREADERANELAQRVDELETLNRLGSDLLRARRASDVLLTAETALAVMLPGAQVQVGQDQTLPSELRRVAVTGFPATFIGVSQEAAAQAQQGIEAVAGLAGLGLQRVKLEAELAENEKALSQLSGRILEEGTHERSRIALEIHDEVLPYFAAAGIQADNARRSLERGESDNAGRMTDLTMEAIYDGVGRLRTALDDMRRVVVVPGGLRESLQSALDELTIEHRLRTHMQVEEPLPQLPLAVEILVVETVRGCLSNVARHARATNVWVSTRARDNAFVVAIADDGRGFDPEAVAPGHQGLALMKQRVGLVRGRLEVGGRQGSGTTVTVEVPI